MTTKNETTTNTQEWVFTDDGWKPADTCLQCEARPARDDEGFCSDRCRRKYWQ